MNQLPLTIPAAEIANFCRRHHIRRLALFGSVLRGDFRPDSDVDVLVEFESGQTPDFRFWEIEDGLAEMLGRKVDLNTPQDLSVYFRRQALAEVKPLYEQTVTHGR